MKKRLLVNLFLSLFLLPVILELLALGGAYQASPSASLIRLCFEKNIAQEDFVEFIDVGQGDSVLIKSGNATALIDFGVKDDGTKIQRHLRRMGIKKLDFAVITHHHSDHMGGFLRVVEKIKIEKLIINNSTAEDGEKELYNEIIKMAKAQKIKLILPKTGQSFKIGNASLKILRCDSSADKENNRSIISKLDINGKRFLFTGDCDGDTENRLMQGTDVKCDVLKMGHHGSSTSSDSEFLSFVQPEIAIASCGYDNIYNHPSENALLRFNELRIRIYRTDLDGDIRFVFENAQNNFKVLTERKAA